METARTAHRPSGSRNRGITQSQSKCDWEGNAERNWPLTALPKLPTGQPRTIPAQSSISLAVQMKESIGRDGELAKTRHNPLQRSNLRRSENLDRVPTPGT